jgi:hypothetical protein
MNLRRVFKLELHVVSIKNGDLLTDSHNILNVWKNYSSIECT